MIKYIAKRLLQMIPVLICVAILIFTLMFFVPGDPVQIMLGDYTSTPEQIAETRARLGIDKPYWEQLVIYLNGIVHLDFGESFILGNDVGEELLERFPRSLTLALSSLGFIVILGVPLGVLCALNAGKLLDKILMVLTLILNSMPTFWLGLLMILLFSVRLNWLPSNGIGGVEYYVMPIIAASVGSLANITRQTRSSMLEVIRSDYVTTARSKGLSERKITYGHALPNALIPIITICGSYFGFMIGGTTVIETVFSIPGIGSYLVNSINSRDYPVVRGSILFIAFSFSVIMLVVDLLYAFADPRIKASYAGNKRKKKETAETDADEQPAAGKEGT